MRKPAFCICENKDADQLRSNREADQRLCFRYIDSMIPICICLNESMKGVPISRSFTIPVILHLQLLYHLVVSVDLSALPSEHCSGHSSESQGYVGGLSAPANTITPILNYYTS